MEPKREPLTESYFYILLCLYSHANHGYGIMQEAGRLSGGRVKIGSGTMYGAVSNMIKKGWIMESDGIGGTAEPGTGSEERAICSDGCRKKDSGGRDPAAYGIAGKRGKGDRQQAFALIFAERENEEENLLPAGRAIFLRKIWRIKG